VTGGEASLSRGSNVPDAQLVKTPGRALENPIAKAAVPGRTADADPEANPELLGLLLDSGFAGYRPRPGMTAGTVLQ